MSEQRYCMQSTSGMDVVLKSLISEVNNATNDYGCINVQVALLTSCGSLFQTFGISSSDSSVAQESTDSSQRSHESAPGQNVEGIIGASSKNYFQQFLSCGKE